MGYGKLLGMPPRSRDAFNESVGSRVREKRVQRGWGQEILARALGVTQGRVSQLERGVYGIDARQLRTLTELFECDADELLPPKRRARDKAAS